MLKAINESEEVYKQTKEQPFVALTSIAMLGVTIHGIIDLTEFSHANGITHVITGRFNQDCLEVLSSQLSYFWLTAKNLLINYVIF